MRYRSAIYSGRTPHCLNNKCGYMESLVVSSLMGDFALRYRGLPRELGSLYHRISFLVVRFISKRQNFLLITSSVCTLHLREFLSPFSIFTAAVEIYEYICIRIMLMLKFKNSYLCLVSCMNTFKCFLIVQNQFIIRQFD